MIPWLPGARALISASCPLPRGSGKPVACAWDRALLGVRGWEGHGVLVARQLPPGLAPLCGPESQPCVLGSCLCPGHPWDLSHAEHALPPCLPPTWAWEREALRAGPQIEAHFLPTLGARERYLFIA